MPATKTKCEQMEQRVFLEFREGRDNCELKRAVKASWSLWF